MSCREVNTRLVIGGQLLGTFNYTFRDIVDSDASIEDIGIVAFSCLIFGNGQRKQWYGELLEMADNQPDKNVKEAIQEIRDDIVQPNPNIDISEVTQQYYVLTVAGAIVDTQGNVIRKVRQLSILPLMSTQVNILVQQGFDVVRTDSMDITSFIDMFEDPIRMNGNPVNDQAITLFASGDSSQKNEGVFDSRINSQTMLDPNRDINPVPLDSDFMGRHETFIDEDGHISTGIIQGGEGSVRMTADGVVAPAGSSSLGGAVLPLGILLLLSGQL